MPRCPSCFSPMVRLDEDGIKSFSCPRCFGNWASRLALTRLVRKATAEPADGGATIAELAETVTTSNATEKLRCAECGKEMIKEKYHPMIPVEIDRCGPCGFVWTDAGEMALLGALYRELTTSTDPEIVSRREKIASALAQWNTRQRLNQQVAEGASDVVDAFNLLNYFLR